MQRLYMSTEQVGKMIEITYNIDIVEEKDEKVKVIKRNIPVKKLVALTDIKNPTQIFSKKGTAIKNKCKIFIKDEGEIVVNCDYDKLKALLTEELPKTPSIIGFKLKNHNKNVKSSRRNKAYPKQSVGRAGEGGQHTD